MLSVVGLILCGSTILTGCDKCSDDAATDDTTTDDTTTPPVDE